MSVTEQQVVTAVLAVVSGALTGGRQAYDVDKVPSTRPAEYVEVSVTRRFGGEPRNDAWVGTTGWRIALRFVSQSSVPDARNMARQAGDALEFAVLTAGGLQSTPVQFEGAEEIGPDDGWFSGLTTYTTTF